MGSCLIEAAGNPYVFNSFNKAAANFSFGTESEPMKVYLAHYVVGLMIQMTLLLFVLVKTAEPFGLVVKCPLSP